MTEEWLLTGEKRSLLRHIYALDKVVVCCKSPVGTPWKHKALVKHGKLKKSSAKLLSPRIQPHIHDPMEETGQICPILFHRLLLIISRDQNKGEECLAWPCLMQ